MPLQSPVEYFMICQDPAPPPSSFPKPALPAQRSSLEPENKTKTTCNEIEGGSFRWNQSKFSRKAADQWLFWSGETKTGCIICSSGCDIACLCRYRWRCRDVLGFLVVTNMRIGGVRVRFGKVENERLPQYGKHWPRSPLPKALDAFEEVWWELN